MVGHQFKLSASRIRPRVLAQGTKCLVREPQLFSQTSQIPFRVPGQRRHFGISDAAGYLLKGSEFLVTNVHELTATPWFISIPLVALMTSTVIRAPLTVWSQRMARKRAKVVPLIQAQNTAIALGLRKKKVSNLMEKISAATKKRSKELLSAFAVSEKTSIMGGLLSLPVFLSNLEVIRRLCGGPRGLIGHLIFGYNGETPTDVSTAATTPSSAEELGELVAAAPQDPVDMLTLDPTFADGGCLWFPSLLEADPYHVLPFAVSAVLVLHMIPETAGARRELFGLSQSEQDNKKTTIIGQTRARRILQRTLLIVSLAVGPVTMDLPVALHLYWLSSAATSLVISKGLKKLMPIPKITVRPCTGMEMPLLRPRLPTHSKTDL